MLPFFNIFYKMILKNMKLTLRKFSFFVFTEKTILSKIKKVLKKFINCYAVSFKNN
jgi:hypothetical protein